MSKLRQTIPHFASDELTPEEGDLRAYVVFTQLRDDGPMIYAGWLDAADDAMARTFAREHYGQDQECVCLWSIPREALGGTEAELPASTTEGPVAIYHVFHQPDAGGQHVSAGTVEATSTAAALDAACAAAGSPAPHSTWVAPADAVVAIGADEVIWRLTDQSYRLARGYAKEVREKWETLRAQRDLDEYEKDDLKDAF